MKHGGIARRPSDGTCRGCWTVLWGPVSLGTRVRQDARDGGPRSLLAATVASGAAPSGEPEDDPRRLQPESPHQRPDVLQEPHLHEPTAVSAEDLLPGQLDGASGG